MYSVGIDLGTSFTSAAVRGPRGTRVVPLGPEVVAPSLVYATTAGILLTGASARDAAGDAAGARGETGRLARDFKRRLGDPTPHVLGGTAYSSAALMAAQLRDVLTRVTLSEGAPPTSVVLTCPAIWGSYRREHFTEVPRLAGIRSYDLITEPEAAAAHYSAEWAVGSGEIVAVYDLGGGTFDSTVLRTRPGGMDILGTPDGIEQLGGADFDEALLGYVDEQLDGAVSALDPADPGGDSALTMIRAACVRAKEDLSAEPDVELSVPLPDGPRTLTITRLRFNRLIQPTIQSTIEALHRTISSAGLRPADLSAILLAGGSSRVPLVGQMIREEFGKPVRVALHPKHTVALGATMVRPPTAPPSARPAPPVIPAVPTGVPARQVRNGNRKRLVPLAAVTAAAVAAAMTIAVNAGAGDNHGAVSGRTAVPPVASGRSAASPTLRIYDRGPVAPYHALIASGESWSGTEVAPTGARHTAIAAEPDDVGDLRVSWAGGAPGQIYMQDVANTRDLASYVNSGALVFDTVVHKAPTGRVTMAVHCAWPCASEVDTTALFLSLPEGRRATVQIPLRCFAKLNSSSVNTPFLVYTSGAFDATFTNIRWVADVPDTTSCANLS